MEVVRALIVPIIVLFFLGIRIVRPTHRGLIERLGKYRRFANFGFNWREEVIVFSVTYNPQEQQKLKIYSNKTKLYK